ncbi:RICIN domain-containing protein [Parafrankia sp. FMc2]|uniref:RICIN domain-containing protein n=1 Tax=Parafrankia sp. FMc2 TaxID=3233196 RepID=UPI0034D51F42
MSAPGRSTALKRWQVTALFAVLLCVTSVLVGSAAAQNAQVYFSWDETSTQSTAAGPSGETPGQQGAGRSWPAASQPTASAPAAAASASGPPAAPGAGSGPGEATSAPVPGAARPSATAPPTRHPASVPSLNPVPLEARSLAPAPTRVATPAPKPAPAPPPPFEITSVANGKCLTNKGGRNMGTQYCRGTIAEKWTMFGYGSVMLVNAGNGLCLDSNDQNHIYGLVCTDTRRHQQWRVVERGGTIDLVNVGNGHCLASVDSGYPYTVTCDADDILQRWIIR